MDLQVFIPGKPHGKASVRTVKRSNQVVHSYLPSETKAYIALVELICKCEMNSKGHSIFKGPVGVKAIFQFFIPTHTKGVKNGDWAVCKPDIDNIQKSLFDGMNKVVFEDDKQIVKIDIEKRYDLKKEGVFLIVTQLEN